MLTTLLLCCTSLLVCPDGDASALAWDSQFESTVTSETGQLGLALGGSRAFSIGELQSGGVFAPSARTVVRAWDRSSGAELWTAQFDDDTALGIETNPDGSLVFALVRQPEASAPEMDRLLVLSGISGAVLFERELASDPTGLFLGSQPIELLLSPSGLTLYRLDYTWTGSESWLRLVAFDTSTGTQRWSDTRLGSVSVWAYGALDTGRGLDVSPDSQQVYLSSQRFAPSLDRFNELVCFSAADGFERWSETLESAPFSLSSSQAFALSDGSGVAVLHRMAAGSRIDVRSSADGSALRSFNSTLLSAGPVPGSFAFSNVTDQLALIGTTSTLDLRIESFDLQTGMSLWGATYLSAGDEEVPRTARFDAQGANLYVLSGRNTPAGSSSYGHALEYLVRRVEAITGASVWRESLQPGVDSLGEDVGAWLDVPDAVSPFVTGGISRAEAPRRLARTALDPLDGSESWSVDIEDRVPAPTSPVGRVWVSNDGASVWSRPHVQDGLQPMDSMLRLEQRDAVDGHLLQSIELQPSEGFAADSFEISFSPYSELAAVGTIGFEAFRAKIVVLDLEAGVPLFEVPLATFSFSGSEMGFRWTPDAASLYCAKKGTAGELVRVDLSTESVAWSSLVPSLISPLTFEGVKPVGLHVDAASQDVFAAWSIPAEDGAPWFARLRYSHADGTVAWSSLVQNDELGFDPFEYCASFAVSPVFAFGTRRDALVGTPSRLFATLELRQSGVESVLVRPIDLATGAGASPTISGMSLGADGAIVQSIATVDGRFVHVLSEGELGSGERGAHVMTVDGTTGELIWERYLDDAIFEARGIASLGQGDRLQVGVTIAGRMGEPAGALVLTLDAITGEELWRSSDVRSGRQLCDFASGLDGRLYTVGIVEQDEAAVGVLRCESAASFQDGFGLSVVDGGSYPMHVDLDADRAGDVYLAIGSATGSSPATPFAGLLVPLIPDSYTARTIDSANVGSFLNTFGFLDAAGDARARVQIPAGVLGASLAGEEFFWAALVFDTATARFDAVTNAVSTVILP